MRARRQPAPGRSRAGRELNEKKHSIFLRIKMAAQSLDFANSDVIAHCARLFIILSRAYVVYTGLLTQYAIAPDCINC